MGNETKLDATKARVNRDYYFAVKRDRICDKVLNDIQRRSTTGKSGMKTDLREYCHYYELSPKQHIPKIVEFFEQRGFIVEKSRYNKTERRFGFFTKTIECPCYKISW